MSDFTTKGVAGTFAREVHQEAINRHISLPEAEAFIRSERERATKAVVLDLYKSVPRGG